MFLHTDITLGRDHATDQFGRAQPGDLIHLDTPRHRTDDCGGYHGPARVLTAPTPCGGPGCTAWCCVGTASDGTTVTLHAAPDRVTAVYEYEVGA